MQGGRPRIPEEPVTPGRRRTMNIGEIVLEVEALPEEEGSSADEPEIVSEDAEGLSSPDRVPARVALRSP